LKTLSKRLREGTVTAEQVVEKIKAGEISRIFTYCVVLDRANALYNMTLDGYTEPGMHWFADEHKNLEKWKTTLMGYPGFPTISGHYLYLLTVQELGLEKNEKLVEWLQPKENPKLSELLHSKKFESPLEEVQSCKAINEFIRMYDGAVGVCLDRIRTAQSAKPIEQWAVDWAKRLCRGYEDAKKLNQDRKISLELLYILLNRWKGVKGVKTLTADDIVKNFGDKRVMEILRLCLPMDRANALHNMTLPGE